MEVAVKKYINLFSTLLIVISETIFSQPDSLRENLEALPIISYDSDVGLGYGGKLFLFDLIGAKESFDFILFNSTKGEQWYKFIFAYPDFESRQRTTFPFSFDFIFEYDKYNKYSSYHPNDYSYYQIGEQTFALSKYDCIYEKVTIGTFFSRGFSKDFSSTLGIQYKSFSLYNLTPASKNIPDVPFDYKNGTEEYFSSFLNIKMDTRNSYINPTSGLTMLLECEYSHNLKSNHIASLRGLASVCYYQELFLKDLILALRASKERVIPLGKPAHFKSVPIGGNNTVRGIPMDKYLYDNALLINCEMRFPLWWKFGGIVGIDLAEGNTNHLANHRWLYSAVTGLRLYMDNFIVRADLGFCNEGTGLYLNFGHLF